MPAVIIYLTETCPYCIRAKRLLDEVGAAYTPISVDFDSNLRAEMIQRSKRFTVPQIFIDDEHIGGFDELNALHLDDALEPRLLANQKEI